MQNALGSMVKPYVTGSTINDPDLKTEVVLKNNGKPDYKEASVRLDSKINRDIEDSLKLAGYFTNEIIK